MSEEALLEILDRSLNDPAFRALLQRAPDEALAGYELTPEERAAFRGRVLRAEQLEERISKTDITALTGPRTMTPITKAPSQLPKRR